MINPDPILRALAQSFPNRIHQDVAGFLVQFVAIAQAVIEKIALPIHAVLFRSDRSASGRSNARISATGRFDYRFHSLGQQLGLRNSRGQIMFAHCLIDEGIAIVHGHSSHHVKAIEVFKGRLILYGCGDFLTDYEGIGGYEMFRIGRQPRMALQASERTRRAIQHRRKIGERQQFYARMAVTLVSQPTPAGSGPLQPGP